MQQSVELRPSSWFDKGINAAVQLATGFRHGVRRSDKFIQLEKELYPSSSLAEKIFSATTLFEFDDRKHEIIFRYELT